MLSKTYTFDSERLTFRGIQRSDASNIVAWRSDPENYYNFINSKPVTAEEHLRWFENYLNDGTRYDFLITDANGRPIGTCGLSNISEISCEISYMIGEPDVRGKGYATEAIRTLSDIAFQKLEVAFIEARILPHNLASKRAAEKCGYREREGIFRLYKDDLSCFESERR